MKICDKKGWNEFTYMLLYPALLGSMIYELVPRSRIEEDVVFYIKIFLVCLYALDFLHLYADMHKRVKSGKRTKIYIFCDVAVSMLFFIGFKVVSLHPTITIISLSIIPGLFLLYKRKNIYDRYYHIPFFTLAFLTGLYYLISNYLWLSLGQWNNYTYILFFSGMELLVYLAYVFIYHNKLSAFEDIRSIRQGRKIIVTNKSKSVVGS
jgi:hypothetical protein